VRRILLAFALLAVVAPAASAQDPLPPGLSREEPISVFGETIAIGEIEHWARTAARAADGGRARDYFEQAAQYLIDTRWIEGEARAQGIDVTPRQVRRSLERQIDQSFPRRREFRAFLRGSGQTMADLRRRVRVDLLANRLRRRAIGDATDPEEQQRRVEAFVADFRARWRSVTLCTPRFVDLPGYCANGADSR
jgi:SurA N-terminal domain